MSKRSWTEFEPHEAQDLLLPSDDVQGPYNEIGQECPWPWEPQQLKGVPMGQYHCPYCGGMQVAGVPHLDHGPVGPDGLNDTDRDYVAFMEAEDARNGQG